MTMNTYHFSCEKNDESSLTKAVEDSLEQAVNLIPDNLASLGDEARYLMLELDSDNHQLIILVSSDDKKSDGLKVVELSLPSPITEQLETTVKFAATDYLTTCNGFLNYSLLAVFHKGDRSKTHLL